MKQEWTSIDTVLKQLEKIVAAGGGETHTAPLAGVMDPVTEKFVHFFLSFFFLHFVPRVLLSGNILFSNGIIYFVIIGLK